MARQQRFQSGDEQRAGALVSQQDLSASLQAAEQRAAEAEARARSAERRLRAVAQSVGQWVWTTDPSGNILHDAPDGRAFSGKSLDQILGRAWMSSIHPDDRPAALAAWDEAIATQTPFEHVLRLAHADGAYRTMLVRGMPVRDEAGNVCEWAGVVTDITESRRSERELRALQVLTDTALAHLSVDDLLRQLTERVREIMDVDNVAILLIDTDGQTLVMRAVCGLEEPVAPHVRVPVGQGFAGRIVARAEPLVVGDLSTIDVVNPVLKESLRSALGVPLRTQDRVLGVLHVGTAETHEFAPHEVRLLERVAARAAQAVERALLYEAAEQARREAEVRARELKSVFDAMADGVFVYDAQGAILQTNEACRRLFAFDARPDYASLPLAERLPLVETRDALGAPVPPEQSPQLRVLRGEVLAGETATDYRLRVLDGREVTVNVSGAPILDAQGHIIAGILMLRDVTERHHHERERAHLAERERQAREDAEVAAARLRTVLEVLPVGVSIVDAVGRPTLVNQETRRIWGQNMPLAESRTLAESEAQYAAYKAWWAQTGKPLAGHEWGIFRALRHGEVALNEEIDIESFDGQRKTMLASCAPVRDESGATVGGVAAILDITERKQLERRTSDALNALVQMAQVLVEPGEVADDEDASKLSTREIAHRLALLTADVLGCQRVGIQVVEPETKLIRPVAVVGLTPEQEPQWWAEQEAVTVHYGEGAEPELLARFDAGEAIVVDMNEPPFDQLPNPYGITTSLTAPMRVGGNVVGILSLDYGGPRHEFVAYEIALAQAVGQLAAMVIERDRLLRQREEARARELALLTINQHMDDFLSMAAHDLRSPVAGAKLIVQTSERRVRRLAAQLGSAQPALAQQGAELERALANVGEQMNRLARLVDRLLDVSRARTGKLEVALEPCDLAALVRDCVHQQRAIAPERTINLKLPGNKPVMIRADSMRIGQVVTNYLTNAVRYSEADKPIDVRLSVGGGQARVTVRDEGPGIPEAERESIWSRFERAKGVKQQTGTDTGLGLGLYISRNLVEQHGGTFGVESEEGCGSTFWFTLPLEG